MMLKNIQDMNFYELLEVNPGASSTEIHRAYERIRRIYEPNSIALYSLFTAEETAAIHQRIEEAYRTLMYEGTRKKYDARLRSGDRPQESQPASPAGNAHGNFQPSRPVRSEIQPDWSGVQADQQQPAAEDVSPVSPFIAEFTGPVIKVLREQRNLSVRNIADSTKLASRFIEAIEEENYTKLPARPYLRGFLILYAKALGYEPERVVSDYLKRFDAAQAK